MTDGTTVLPLLERVSAGPDGAGNRGRWVVRITNVGSTAFPEGTLVDVGPWCPGDFFRATISSATVGDSDCVVDYSATCDASGLAPGASRLVTVRATIDVGEGFGGPVLTVGVRTAASGIPIPNPWNIAPGRQLAIDWDGPDAARTTLSAGVTVARSGSGSPRYTLHVTITGIASGHQAILNAVADGPITSGDPMPCRQLTAPSGWWACLVTPTADGAPWSAALRVSGGTNAAIGVLSPWWTQTAGSTTILHVPFDTASPETPATPRATPVGSVTGGRGRPVLRHLGAPVPVRVRCATACRAAVSLRLARGLARRLGLPARIATLVRRLPAGDATLDLRLSPRARRVFGAGGGRLVATLRVVLTGAGAPVSVGRRVLVRPR